MSSWSTDSEPDTERFPINRLDELTSNTTCYLVLQFIGEGTFGKVAECVDLKTGEKVAMKMITGGINEHINWEVEVLEQVRAFDSAQNNFVRLIEYFKFKGVSCLALEMLEGNLLDEVYQKAMHFKEIRPVTHQLFQALETLKAVGIVHADLKPDNVMFVNQKDQPFKVKLIDFGVALPTRAMHLFSRIQPYGFKAPEVLLGLPLSEASDMWGVGCIMAFIYFGIPIFPQYGSYYMLREMVRILGQPEDHLLNAGKDTWKYFSKEYDSRSGHTTQWRWRLKSPQEYEEATGLQYREETPEWTPLERSLEWEVLKSLVHWEDIELEDGMAFLSLLKQCLHWDAKKRITPREALKHSFITMAHLAKNNNSSYRDEAHSLMTVCHLDPLNVNMRREDDIYPGFFSLLYKMKPELCHGYLMGPSVTTDHHDGDREESAATCSDYVPAIGEINDGGAPAAAGSTDGASAVICSTDASAAPSDDYSVAATNADHRHVNCLPVVSTSNDDGVLAAADSSDGASVAISSEDRTATATKEECAPIVSNTDDGGISAPSFSADGAAASIFSNNEAAAANTPIDVDGPKKKKQNVFRRVLKFFQKRKTRLEISSQENSEGPSTSNRHGGGRDTAALAKGESAAATSHDNKDAYLVSTRNDEGASAASCSADGATTSTSSNDGAAAAFALADEEVVKKKKKNVFQRTFKFSRRAFSIFKH